MEAMRKQLLIIFLVYGLVSVMCTTFHGEFIIEPCLEEICTFACKQMLCGFYHCPGGYCVPPNHPPPMKPYWTCDCLPRIGN
ncbi:hypothetical protein ACP275_07G077000 [Erythranthe tilingii]